MPKLVQKSGYIQAGKAGGYMKYIATREGVEKLELNGPVTKGQQQLIKSLLKDFPDTKELFEYQDYRAEACAKSASAFISMALDANLNEIDSKSGYMKYIANRPRVEKHGTHGLFSAAPSVDLEKTILELEQHEGPVWTIIYSLRREDAARLSYDNANAWRNLLMNHESELADAMRIPEKDFRWYAAFHNEGHHPHIHMMVWSDDPQKGFLTKEGIAAMRSKLTNTIFQDEMKQLYAEKDVAYKELSAAAQNAMQELIRKMQNGFYDSPVIEQKMQELVEQLQRTTGKKQYGYLKKPMKKLVDEIVDELAKHPDVAACYEKWNQLRDELERYYHEQEPRPHQPLSQQKEFRVIKNMIIREADGIRLGTPTFEDEKLDDEPEPEFEQKPESEFEPEEEYSPQTEARPRNVYEQAALYREAKKILNDPDLTAEEKETAIQTLEQLWSEGYTVAAHQLGKFYRDDLGIKRDLQKAELWFRRSAEAGNDYSEYALGKLLESENRIEEALHWYEKAVAQANQFALYRLGKLNLTGEKIPKDVEKAINYLKRSADDGNQYAQYTLGKLYLLGRDVKPDREQAREWLTQSADQGNEYARFFLDHFDQFRDPSVLLAATRLLHQMARTFQDNQTPPATPKSAHIESKRRKRLREKRMAIGHKADDHEEHPQIKLTM